MAKKSSRSARVKPVVTKTDLERLAARAGLIRASKREQEIQRLSRRLDRLFQTSRAEVLELARNVAAINGYKLVPGDEAPAAGQ